MAFSCMLVGGDFKWCMVLSSKSQGSSEECIFKNRTSTNALFGFFYPKEELSGKRLHKLDQ